MGTINKIKNYLGFGPVIEIAKNPKNVGKSILPIQLQRIKQDTATWRLSIEEAERAYFPFRVQMQQLYIDTILNGHVKACIDRRKDLTLLRNFHVVNKNGTVDEKSTSLINEMWFNQFLSLSLDALFFGYSLISLGDIENDKFTEIQTIKRWNISPDRKVVTAVTYNVDGIKFLEEDCKDWHVWVQTPNELGTSSCGYGLLYNVGIYEIFLRNILGFNGDFVELFSQPFRIGKTSKTEEAERNAFEIAVRDMGSNGYAIMDDMGDTIEFMETAKGGNGWQGYDNFEQRIEKKISKILLGHADALDSVAGSIGATQGENSPTAKALEDKQSKDGSFITDIVNNNLFPKMRNLGFNIPIDAKFEFKNDSEVNENNAKITALAVEIKKAGLQMDKAYFEEQTGIKLSETTAPVLGQSIKNKLDKLYV